MNCFCLHYVAPLVNIITSFGVEFHQYTDDTPLYNALNQSNMMAKLRDIEQCSKAIHNCFLRNNLALNPDKTEVLLMGSVAKLHHINCINGVNIAGADVSLVDWVKSLDVITDSRLTFGKHVNKICQASYFHVMHYGMSRPLCLLISRNLLPALLLVHS